MGHFRLGLLVGSLLWGQAPTVFIENADELGGTAALRVLRGNVILRQDTLWLYCGEATLEEGGRFTAQGATRTQIGRTGTIYAERLLYEPTLQRLTYAGSVRAVFPSTTFEAPQLHYDRQTETLSTKQEASPRYRRHYSKPPLYLHYTHRARAFCWGGAASARLCPSVYR